MRIKKTYNGVVPNGKIVNSESNSVNDTYSCNFINELTGVVLWTNENPTQNFEAQTIALSDEIENYKYYEVIYKQAPSVGIYYSTGKILSGNPTRISIAMNYIYNRFTAELSGTSMAFRNCTYYATYNGSQTTSNDVIIPYQVIGYK